MMSVIRNSDGSSLCHTLSIEIGGTLHPVHDFSSFDEAESISNQINDTGLVIHATEFSPMLYTVGQMANDKFEPQKDFSDFNEAFNWCQNQ